MRVVRVRIPVSRVVRYFKGRWGVPFIVVFQGLLLCCAFLLAVENAMLANDVAVYAYYFLVVGVVLEVICFFRNRRKVVEQKPTATDKHC